MSTIKLDESAMLSKIAQLKEQKRRIDDVLARVKGDVVKVIEYWSGEAGEAAKENLDKNTNEYDYISSKLEAQIRYLERVVERYRLENADTVRAFDRNNTTAAI